jgi:hypothetical protein
MADPNELTPQNAPRDAVALAEKSPFQLRLLAERHLGSMRTEAEKQAWYQLKTTDARVTYILELLKRWDQQNPGAAAPTNGVSGHAMPAPVVERTPVVNSMASSLQPGVQQMQPVAPIGAPTTGFVPPPTTMTTPLTSGVGVVGVAAAGAVTAGPGFIPNVSPGAIAAAGAVAAGEKPKRAPKTNAGAGAAVDLGADVINFLQRLIDGQDKDRERYDAMQKNVSSILEEAASMKASRITELEVQYKALTAQMTTLTNLVESTWKVQIWTMMMLLQSQSAVNGVSPIDVLRSAIEDGNNFQSIVNQATGKA